MTGSRKRLGCLSNNRSPSAHSYIHGSHSSSHKRNASDFHYHGARHWLGGRHADSPINTHFTHTYSFYIKHTSLSLSYAFTHCIRPPLPGIPTLVMSTDIKKIFLTIPLLLILIRWPYHFNILNSFSFVYTLHYEKYLPALFTYLFIHSSQSWYVSQIYNNKNYYCKNNNNNNTIIKSYKKYF